MKRKLLSILLTLCLAFSLLPTAALADGEGTPAPAEVPAAVGTALPAAVDGVITLRNDSYVMSEDTTAFVNVPAGVTATLDLGGKTLTNKADEHTIIVENGATLTITGNGIVDNVSHGKGAIVNSGEVTLNGGTFKRSQDAGTASPNNANGNSWYTVKNFGTMVINSGVTIENKGSFSSAIANGWYDVTKAGNGSEPAHSADAVLTINGGNISGGKITVKNDDGGKLTINDGTFTQSESNLFCIYNANVAKITGGTINGCVGSIESNPSSEYNKGEFTISGGTFNTDVSEFVADGYILNNGTVEKLGESNAVAKVGDTYYKTLADAIAAAKDGEKVILLSDRKNFVTNTINANITIDLNGKTLSVGNNVSEMFKANGEVTIQNGKITSDMPCAIVNAYNKLTLKNVKITGVTGNKGKNLVNVCRNAEVTIDKDTVLTASGSNGAAVFIGQDADAKYTLNVYGKVIQESKSFAISGNGSYKGTTTINIYDGAEVKSAIVAIYHPQAGVINVNGGLVEGYCAIGIKSGALNISGGTVRGTADDHVLDDSNSTSGTIIYDGSAIVVDSRATGYAGNVKINVTGGTVESYYSTAIREIGEQDKPNMTQLTELKVTGGNVFGASSSTGNVTNDMLVRDISVSNVSVSGGAFKHKVPQNYCAPGFVPKTNDDSTYGVKIKANMVAEVLNAQGNTVRAYDSLDKAIAVAQDGQTVKLLSDVVLTSTLSIAADKKITLDLNGCKISADMNGPHMICNAGYLAITDSSTAKTGEIAKIGNASNFGYVIENHGTMLLESCKITSTSSVSSAIENGWFTPAQNTSGTNCTMSIQNAEVTSVNAAGGLYTVKNDDYGVMVINGGIFTNGTEGAGAVLNWNNLTIYNGTFTGTSAVRTLKSGSHEYETGRTYIQNGIFNGKVDTLDGYGENIDVNISGGKFSQPVKEEYCATGFIPTANDDNTYGVKQGAYYAEINDTKYESLQAAVDAVQNNETITILKAGGTATVSRTVKFTVVDTGNLGYTIRLGSYCTDRDANVNVFDVVYSAPSSSSSSDPTYSVSTPSKTSTAP